MNKTILAITLGLTTCVSAVAADLQTGDRLEISDGSYFSLGGGAFGTTPILGENGLIVGQATGDTGTGSHSGFPTATDVGAVTQPWGFFANTGYDFLSVNHGSGSFGGSTSSGVDMTAWAVTWNGISEINLGGCFLFSGGCTSGYTVFTDTGIGAFSWDGTYGDTYTIDYTAHVPVGDPSGFGGIQYDLHLTGKVTQGGPLPPTTHVAISLPGGSNYTCNAGGSTVTASANIITSDTNDIVSVDWALDGATVGSGNSLTTFIPFGAHNLSVSVNTLSSGQLTATQTINVNDLTPPTISAAFINTQTGDEVTVLSDGVKSALQSGNVTVQYSASDTCDKNPQVEATLGVEVANGDDVKLNRGANKLLLQGDTLANSVELTVIATDEAGHKMTLKKVLSQ